MVILLVMLLIIILSSRVLEAIGTIRHLGIAASMVCILWAILVALIEVEGDG